ncbi:MAG: hypothetical protein AMJ65_12340, partial [Phycisphaerae bacterium SG8_4]
MTKARVLRTTVCRPFGGAGEGDSVGAELFHSQVIREQGIFRYRKVIRRWGLDYIAENIQAPSVVLHYPSERELDLCDFYPSEFRSGLVATRHILTQSANRQICIFRGCELKELATAQRIDASWNFGRNSLRHPFLKT